MATMTPEALTDIIQHTLWLMGLLSAPALLASLVLGVGIAVVQVVTSIQEQTLSFVPKMVVVLVVLAVTLPWMLSTLLTFGQDTFTRMQQLG
jgi:flagellar biosynthesis protein FliQ